MATKKPPANDNETEALRKILEAAEDLKKTSSQLQTDNKRLEQEKDQTQKTLDAERADRTSQQEGRMKILRKIAEALGVALMVTVVFVGVVYLGSEGYVNLRPGTVAPKGDKLAVTEAVKEGLAPIQNAIAGLDKRFNALTEKVDDNAAKQQKLASAVAQLATAKAEDDNLNAAEDAAAAASLKRDAALQGDGPSRMTVARDIYADKCGKDAPDEFDEATRRMILGARTREELKGRLECNARVAQNAPPSPVIDRSTPTPRMRMANAGPASAGRSISSCPPGTVFVRQVGCAPVLRRR